MRKKVKAEKRLPLKGMQKTIIRCLKAFRVLAITLVILLAMIMGLGKMLLPLVADHEPEIEAWLSERIGKPVSTGSISAAWSWQGPRIQLHNLSVHGLGTDSGSVDFALAELKIDLYAWARTGSGSFVGLSIVGAHLGIVQRDDGSFRLQGLDELQQGRDDSGSSVLDFLLSQSSISLKDSRLSLHLNDLNNPVQLRDLNAHLVSQDGRHRITLEAILGTGDESIVSLQLEIDRDDQDQLRVAKAYIDAHNLLIPAELYAFYPNLKSADYSASLEAWLVSTGEGIRRVQGNLIVSGHSTSDGFSSPLLSTRFELLGTLKQWDLSLPGITLQGIPAAQGMRIQRNNRQLRVQATEIQLAAVLAATVGQLITEETADRLMSIDGVSGNLWEFSAIWEPGRPLSTATAYTSFQNLKMPGGGSVPGISGLNGSLNLLDGTLSIDLDSSNIRLDFPLVFRQELDLDSLEGHLTARVYEGHVVVDADVLKLSGPDGKLSARLLLDFDLAGGKPFIDLISDLEDVKIGALHKYWPVNRFTPKLLDWLDTALVGGEVLKAAVLLNGDLDDWPFQANEGRFEITATTNDASIDYHPEWPRLDSINGKLRVLNTRLSMEIESARILGAEVGQLSAVIPDLKYPVIAVTATGQGQSDALLAIIKASPLQASHGAFISGMSLSGDSAVQLELSLPLRPELGSQKVSGSVALNGVGLLDPRWDLNLADLRGVINFTDVGFLGERIYARYEGIDVEVAVAAGNDTRNELLGFEASMTGHMPIQTLLRDYAYLGPILSRVDGASTWVVGVTVPANSRTIEATRLQLQSDMLGTRLNFPEPLYKRKGQRQNFSLSMPFPYAGEEIHIRYGDVLDAAFATAPGQGGASSASLVLGGGVARLPETAGLWVSGDSRIVDALSWLPEVDVLFPEEFFSGEMDLESLDISADRMPIFSNEFHSVRLNAKSEDGRWVIDLKGDELDGRIRLPLDSADKGNLVAEFKRLDWSRSDVEQVDFAYDPADMPAVHLLVEDLTFAGIKLGTARMEAYPLAGGIRVESLETSSPNLEVRASGDWLLNHPGGPRSAFTINLTSESLGEMLSVLGFADVIDGGQSLARFDVWWPGSPASFALGKLGGDLDVSVGPGTLPEVSPGAGRLFGLLSIQALPRRLLLDFTDLFDKGLKFDSIQGRFSLQSGEAYTQDLIVRSRSADIIIDGRVGLGDRDYNQVVIVVPKVSQTLPAFGAIAAGPAGAAAMIAVQAVFGEKIAEVTQYRYSLTGTWDEPKVELLGASGGTVTRPAKRKTK